MNIRNRKAISPLITTLLLIAIAVAASVLTYSWVMSMVGSQSAQAQTQVRIDNVAWAISASTSHDNVTVTIRNTGSIAADIESITIRKNTAGSTTYSCNDVTATGAVDVGLVVTKVWHTTTALPAVSGNDYITNGTAYVVRVTTKTGFYYELVATSPTS